MSCVPTRKDGVAEFVINALYYRAVCYSETMSEMTTLVILLMVCNGDFGPPKFWSCARVAQLFFFISNEFCC